VTEAVDLIPFTAFVAQGGIYPTLPNVNWDQDPGTGTYKDVYSIVTGTGSTFAAESGLPGLKIRTSEGTCYEYKHVVFKPSVNGPITAGDPIGTIRKSGQDNTEGPLPHLHLGIYPCKADTFEISGPNIPPLQGSLHFYQTDVNDSSTYRQ
jgi:hypothetical protein